VSFILDALKKSENERQRQAGPGFATVPGNVGGHSRNFWPLALATIVAVNLAVLGFLLLRDDDGDDRTPPAVRTTPPPSQQAATTPRPAATPPPKKTQTKGSTPPTPAVRQAPAHDSETPVAAPDAKTAPAVSPIPEREVRGLEREAASNGTTPQPPRPATAGVPTETGAGGPLARPRSSEPAARSESLPTANDLRLQGFLTGPPLHLDLHVYYPESYRRVVFISGSKYREGDRVKNGPVVREIVPEGVVLEERGQRYLLMPD
jgi:general secretion pathway protein B